MEEMRDEKPNRARPARDAKAPREETPHPEARDEGVDAEAVRRRAYELYLARGDAPGDEVEDWVAAEREVRLARESDGASRSKRSGSDGGRD